MGPARARQALSSRDHRFDASQSGDPLIQRLEHIAVGMDEEESLTLPRRRWQRRKAAFDVDKVTKKFYDRFKAEHAAFLKFIKGIKARRRSSVVHVGHAQPLDVRVLHPEEGLSGRRHRLSAQPHAAVRQAKGKDKFHHSTATSFCGSSMTVSASAEERKLTANWKSCSATCPTSTAASSRSTSWKNATTDIDIPDKAFEKLFDFFDQFRGISTNGPLRADNEINPDVVGYIFEKYINQKQMGAYYTKEDITEYISKNTIIPFLFDAAREEMPHCVQTESYLWRLLRDDPDRYIYAAVRRGVRSITWGQVIPLPKEIEAGVEDVAKRDGWNKRRPPNRMPSRRKPGASIVARRHRCLELREKLATAKSIDQRSDHAQPRHLAVRPRCHRQQRRPGSCCGHSGRRFLDECRRSQTRSSNPELPCSIRHAGRCISCSRRSGFWRLSIATAFQAMASFVHEPEPTATTTLPELVQNLISTGESDRLEFKSSARYDVKIGEQPIPEANRKEVLRQKDKERQQDILKAVAAMLNSDGGDVVIGVRDDGSVFGIERDFEFFESAKRNPDQYELWLRNLFVEHYGVLLSQRIQARFVMLEQHLVCWLHISSADSPAYVKTPAGKTFFIRNGNRSRAVEIDQIASYHNSRFSEAALAARKENTSVVPTTKKESTVKKPRFNDFRNTLQQVGQHRSERYFILKSIIIGNLFGVDIMEEAVEICKLRLFLKLVAEVETFDQIEPLPDIDFNIRAGNTLVGYVSLAEIQKSQAGTLGFGASEVKRIEEDSLAVEKCFDQFRAQQTTHGGKVTSKAKWSCTPAG